MELPPTIPAPNMETPTPAPTSGPKKSLSLRMDRSTLVKTVKQLLADAEDAENQEKVAIAIRIFDILVSNKWFLVDYTKFRYVVMAKSGHLIHAAPEVFLPYWKELYSTFQVGKNREIRIPNALDFGEGDAPYYIVPSDADVKMALPDEYRPLNQYYDVFRERDINYLPTGYAVLAPASEEDRLTHQE